MSPPDAPALPPSPGHAGVHIGVLDAAHVHAYKALRDAALRDAPEAFTSDYASALPRPAESYAARFGPPASGTFFLGAFDEATGALLGSIGCERESRLQQRHCAQVVGMMVATSAHRRGIGRTLLRECIAHARQVEGLEQLVLTVTAANPHVVRLYESEGFRPWGLLPRAIVVAGTAYDKLHMHLPLPQAAISAIAAHAPRTDAP
ncbi:RimJ/RimL family protein N-acetyltransferase [Paracidovorax anthurii]|uniref:RimJ/RimL family protein N-acetyltransferase n=1 Tax=Paracidovorax anthurii TaxID=78229 RepID=A0A328ZE00_9BURK|nr:GNAT family N-acetyltransferase [Paracidovorax anthurii]RAR83934.1 RimJ/RimL family protein N-acetyltransferase [Paracidovorax anthurii]